MSRVIRLVLLAAILTAAQAEESGASAAEQSASAEHTSSPTSTTPGSLTGRVIEAVNAAGYTYVHFDTGKEKVWAAAPEFVVAVGETVTISSPMPMRDYHSKTLDRTFELVYFVARVEVEGAERRPAKAPSAGPSWRF